METAREIEPEKSQEELWVEYQRAFSDYERKQSFKNWLAKIDAHRAWVRVFLDDK